MLILGREVGQTILIGDDISVTILGARGAQVRVGINAPKEIPVHREEVYERIKREEQAAQTGRVSGAVENEANRPKSSTLKLPPTQRR